MVLLRYVSAILWILNGDFSIGPLLGFMMRMGIRMRMGMRSVMRMRMTRTNEGMDFCKFFFALVLHFEHLMSFISVQNSNLFGVLDNIRSIHQEAKSSNLKSNAINANRL